MNSIGSANIDMDKFSKEQLAEFQEGFKLFDRNGDGHITLEELDQAMRQCGQTPTKLELQILMRQADKDRNGVITFDEFVEFMSIPPHKRYSNNDLQARFDLFDKDSDGFITREEMVSIVKELELGEEFPQAAIDAIFEEADTNKDGKISLPEFLDAMK